MKIVEALVHCGYPFSRTPFLSNILLRTVMRKIEFFEACDQTLFSKTCSVDDQLRVIKYNIKYIYIIETIVFFFLNYIKAESI